MFVFRFWFVSSADGMGPTQKRDRVCSKTFVAYLQIVTVFLRESFIPTFKNFQQHSRVIQTLTNHERFTNFVFLR